MAINNSAVSNHPQLYWFMFPCPSFVCFACPSLFLWPIFGADMSFLFPYIQLYLLKRTTTTLIFDLRWFYCSCACTWHQVIQKGFALTGAYMVESKKMFPNYFQILKYSRKVRRNFYLIKFFSILFKISIIFIYYLSPH